VRESYYLFYDLSTL